MARMWIALLLVAAGVVAAQQPGASKRFLRDYASMQKQIWLSPFRMDHQAALSRALPLVVGAGTLIAVDRRIQRGLPNTKDQLLWGNRISRAGALYTLGAATVLPMVAGKLGKNEDALLIGRTSLNALAASMTVNYALKSAFGRERPDKGVGNGPLFRGGDSFPSGHSMTTWALCTAIARHHRTPKWAKFASYAVATTVSLARVGAGRHFTSDVFAGAVMGGMIGHLAATRSY